MRMISARLDGRLNRYWIDMDTPPETRCVILLEATLDGETIEIEVPCTYDQVQARQAELLALQSQPEPQPVPEWAAAVVGRPGVTLVQSRGIWGIARMILDEEGQP